MVDDDRSMSKMLCRAITAAGLDVAVFGSAEEFLQYGSINDSACLVLDINLPGTSGIELQQRLKDSHQDLPIIFVSAEADDETRQRLLEAGALGFFSKPFSIESLLETVRSVVPAYQ